MCTFLNTLPKKSKTAGTLKKRNLVLSIRPCPDTASEKTWYRFRILNFGSQNNTGRDYPFITRYVHQIWKKNDKGYPEIESEVICPVTKWTNWEGDRYSCPICRYVNQQYNTLKSTGWKNADANQKKKTFERKYQAIIPVYVVNDPNYEGNNGKFKVLIFNDSKEYNALREKLEKQLLKTNCFNGVNAADLCIHMSLEEQKVNEGKENEYKWNKKVIDTIAFSKPYDLTAITKEAVDKELPFDDTYYIQSTKDELDAFYKKYIKVSNDDIVESDEDQLHVYDDQNKTEVQKSNSITSTILENTKPEEPKTITADDLDDIAIDKPIESTPLEPMKTDSKPDILDADALLAGIEI